jgi:anti-anti-sigma factor
MASVSGEVVSSRFFEWQEHQETLCVLLKDEEIKKPGDVRLFKDELFLLIEEAKRRGCKDILINFVQVVFLPSPALGKIISFYKETKRASIKLILRGIRPGLYEVFEITRLSELFNIQ